MLQCQRQASRIKVGVRSTPLLSHYKHIWPQRRRALAGRHDVCRNVDRHLRGRGALAHRPLACQTHQEKRPLCRTCSAESATNSLASAEKGPVAAARSTATMAVPPSRRSAVSCSAGSAGGTAMAAAPCSRAAVLYRPPTFNRPGRTRFTASRVAGAGALVSARRRRAGRGRLSSRTKADVQDAAVVCAATLPHRLRLGAGCVRRKGHPRRRHRAPEARPASRPLLLLLCEAWPGEAWITAPGLLWFTDPSYATCHAPAAGARALRQARARP